jgi:hypothetical protein
MSELHQSSPLPLPLAPLFSSHLSPFSTGPAKVLHCPTGSYISILFLACGLLIAVMMEAASTSETWANFYQTARRNNPEDIHLHTRYRENLKSHFSSSLARQPCVGPGLLKKLPPFFPVPCSSNCFVLNSDILEHTIHPSQFRYFNSSFLQALWVDIGIVHSRIQFSNPLIVFRLL